MISFFYTYYSHGNKLPVKVRQQVSLVLIGKNINPVLWIAVQADSTDE